MALALMPGRRRPDWSADDDLAAGLDPDPPESPVEPNEPDPSQKQDDA